jgi:chromosome partitioning protein
MVTALVNQKGGVGKSTLSVHLAVWLFERGRKVVLVDADAQGASSVWLKEAAPDITIVRLQTPDDILEQIPKLQAEADEVIVDGPAGLSELTRTILFVTEFAILPCGPSVLDLRAVNDAIRVVRQVQTIRKGPPRAVLVPNRLQVQYRLSQELLEASKGLEIPAVGGLRLRQAYADAVGQGTVVWRMATQSARDAAEEVQELFRELYESDTQKNDERRIAVG